MKRVVSALQAWGLSLGVHALEAQGAVWWGGGWGPLAPGAQSPAGIRVALGPSFGPCAGELLGKADLGPESRAGFPCGDMIAPSYTCPRHADTARHQGPSRTTLTSAPRNLELPQQ